MTISECYEMIGANYSDVMARFQKESLVERFFIKFVDDKTIESLKAACDISDRNAAFGAAHTLKGVANNLSLTGLGTAAAKLTEQLRSLDKDPDKELVDNVMTEYSRVIEIINKYKSER